jgi:hypothetical protein
LADGTPMTTVVCCPSLVVAWTWAWAGSGKLAGRPAGAALPPGVAAGDGVAAGRVAAGAAVPAAPPRSRLIVTRLVGPAALKAIRPLCPWPLSERPPVKRPPPVRGAPSSRTW